MEPGKDIQILRDIMSRLREPQTGCPWDIEQNFQTIAPYTIEEAYEVADAIERNDMVDLVEELGDLLLQVVYHSQMAEEAGHFTFENVVEQITKKLIRRHPHVFEDADAHNPEEVKKNWDRIKAEEKAEKAIKKAELGLTEHAQHHLLDSVEANLPSLKKGQKISKTVAKKGFDWETVEDVFAKLDEEIQEVKEAITEGDQAHIEEEIGDLLFVITNISRKCGVEAETALMIANQKFTRRFNAVEDQLKEAGGSLDEASLSDMEVQWQIVKSKEKTTS